MGMVIRFREDTITTIPIPPYTSYASTEWAGEVKPIIWGNKREQDNTGSWSCSIPYTTEFIDILADSTRRITAYFYLDGEEQMHGLVDDVELDISGDKLVYTITGLGEVGALDQFLSKNLAHYQDMELIAILYDILYWAGWAVGDFSTMLVTGEKTTIDVRDLQTVLPQIRKVCAVSPGLHWRYGGVNAEGIQTLDFGYFDEIGDIRLQQGTARVLTPSLATTIGQIQTIKIRESRKNLVSEVHVNGGAYNLSGDPDRQRLMNTWHVNALLTAFPALADPDYTIITDGNGFLRIRNVALYPAGGSSRETWDFVVTENTIPATLAEVTAGAYGLYKKGIRYLQEHAETNPTYSVAVGGLKTLPLAGDRIYVDANFLTTSIPGCSHIQIPGLELHEDLRIGSVSLKGAGDKITSNYALSQSEFVGPGVAEDGSDDIEQYSESWDEQPYNRRWGALTGDFGTQYQLDNTVVQAAGAASDCVLTVSGILGKSITIPIPATPPGATKVFVIGFAPTPTQNYLLEITQVPSLVQPLIVCYSWGQDWTVADSVTLKVYFRFL